VHGHRLKRRILGEQVVHTLGRVPLGLGVARLHVELVFDPTDRVAQPNHQVGLDRVFHDRVAVGLDTGDVIGNFGLGEGHT
jgi:hypothetical protein